MEIKIRNRKTAEVLHFSDDWEIVGEKYKAKIRGKDYIGLFKHWAKVNHNVETETDKHRKQFLYNKEKDELAYRYVDGSTPYKISFCSTSALNCLEDGKIYSYYELVGKE